MTASTPNLHDALIRAGGDDELKVRLHVHNLTTPKRQR